jgi:hypothetical protein
VQWKPFVHNEQTYDLGHLHPSLCSYFQPAKGSNPPRGYRVNVLYSLHCFTREGAGETVDPLMQYNDDRETRTFDFRRYNLSLQLPEIIKNLMGAKCYEADRGNFFTVHVADEQGNSIDYEVYFTASKSSTAGLINLFVQSAYPRDVAYRSNRPKKHPKPIGFAVVLFNASK